MPPMNWNAVATGQCFVAAILFCYFIIILSYIVTIQNRPILRMIFGFSVLVSTIFAILITLIIPTEVWFRPWLIK